MTRVTAKDIQRIKAKGLTVSEGEGCHAFAIGIDPGTHCGISVWDREKKIFLSICSMPIHKALEEVKLFQQRNPFNFFVRVEDAGQAVFGRNTEQDRIKAQGAGSIKRDVAIWRDFLKDLGVGFELVRPDKKKTKWSAELFRHATGWTADTNEHGRDSALLVFGL